MKDLRLELRFKNALLWNLIQESFPCPAESCRTRWTGVRAAAVAIGIHYHTLLKYLNLHRSPFDKQGREYTSSAQKVAALFKTIPEEIFPRSLYQLRLPRLAIKEIESERILSFQEARAMKLLPAYEMDTKDMEGVRKSIDAVLSSLRPREQQVIRKRFGLDDGEEKTFREIGTDFAVTPGRAREILFKAMRDVRHHSKAKQLVEALREFD